MHTDNIEGKVGLKSEEIMKTFMVLDQTFQKIYPINQQKRSYKLHMPLGNAIGRYPEDTFFGGNPWFLLTSTFAEFCYRQAQLSEQKNMHYQKFHAKTLQMLSRFLYLDGKFSSQFMANAWKLKGDQYLARVLHHMDDSGHQSEQIDKNSGELRGARDLTWSYAAFLTAVSYRQELLK